MMTERWVSGIALALGIIAGLYAWAVYGDAPDLGAGVDPGMPIVPMADRSAPPPPVRTISILSGDALRYSVVYINRRLVLEATVDIDPETYEQLPAFRHCEMGCPLRVYIVQERK